MPRQPFPFTFKRAVLCVGAAGFVSVAFAACGTESNRPPDGGFTSLNGSSTGVPADSTRNQPSNAVAGIRISPQTIRVLLNGSTGTSVYPVDARGIPSLALLAGNPTYSVRKASIATVGVDGTLRGHTL